MKVHEAMTTEVLTVTPDTTLKEAAVLMARNGISGMPVVTADLHVLGVVSEADVLVKEATEHRSGGLFRWILDPDPMWATRADAITVGEAMSAPARTVSRTRSVADVAAIMLEEGINRLPVVDADGVLVGLISRGDLVRAFARTDAEIRREIEEDVIHGAMWLDPEALDVTVTNGMVTLAGEVASAADAELLPTFARKVPGVVDVSSSVTHRES